MGKWSKLDEFFNSKTFSNSCLRDYASVNSTCAQLPPGQLRGICPPCQSRGWGIWKFCTAWGPGICQPPGHFRAFDTHAVFYQNITTQKVLLDKKQIGSSVKDRNKLQRVVKACSRFYMYVCISSLLIKPELLPKQNDESKKVEEED